MIGSVTIATTRSWPTAASWRWTASRSFVAIRRGLGYQRVAAVGFPVRLDAADAGAEPVQAVVGAVARSDDALLRQPLVLPEPAGELAGQVHSVRAAAGPEDPWIGYGARGRDALRQFKRRPVGESAESVVGLEDLSVSRRPAIEARPCPTLGCHRQAVASRSRRPSSSVTYVPAPVATTTRSVATLGMCAGDARELRRWQGTRRVGHLLVRLHAVRGTDRRSVSTAPGDPDWSVSARRSTDAAVLGAMRSSSEHEMVSVPVGAGVAELQDHSLSARDPVVTPEFRTDVGPPGAVTCLHGASAARRARKGRGSRSGSGWDRVRRAEPVEGGGGRGGCRPGADVPHGSSRGFDRAGEGGSAGPSAASSHR
jgi:hypothetical protein